MRWGWFWTGACRPRKLLLKTHPGLSVRGGKFCPWTAQKRPGQVGSGVEAEPELAWGGSSPTWVAAEVLYCRSLWQCRAAMTGVTQLLGRHGNCAVTRWQRCQELSPSLPVATVGRVKSCAKHKRLHTELSFLHKQIEIYVCNSSLYFLLPYLPVWAGVQTHVCLQLLKT